MTKTPDEIKKGMVICYYDGSINKCVRCPYSDGTCGNDLNAIEKDAIAYIQQLEKEVKRLENGLDHEKKITEAQMELIESVEAERDAAVADMTEMAKYGGENCCEWCDQTECECTCADVGIYAGFNWRGVQKEDTQ